MPPRHEFDRTAENRVRRAARRQGYTLAKIQRRDPNALGWNRWLLRDEDGTLLITNVVRGIETGASLDEVGKFLRDTGRTWGTATDAVLGLARDAARSKTANGTGDESK